MNALNLRNDADNDADDAFLQALAGDLLSQEKTFDKIEKFDTDLADYSNSISKIQNHLSQPALQKYLNAAANLKKEADAGAAYVHSFMANRQKSHLLMQGPGTLATF